MNEDLRYLERLLSKNEPKSIMKHPSNKLLANFIDGKLDDEEREQMFEHLVLCDLCSDIVATTASQKTKNERLTLSKLQVINTFMAMVASVLLFIFISFPDGSELGMINLSEGVANANYKTPHTGKKLKEKVDADHYLNIIVSSTDMGDVPHYKKAQILEKKGMYLEARAMYKQAFITIRHHENAKERIKQKIVINYRLMQLGIKEKVETDVSINAYKEVLRYDIGLYVMEYQNK